MSPQSPLQSLLRSGSTRSPLRSGSPRRPLCSRSPRSPLRSLLSSGSPCSPLRSGSPPSPLQSFSPLWSGSPQSPLQSPPNNLLICQPRPGLLLCLPLSAYSSRPSCCLLLVPCAPMSILCPLSSCYLIIVSVAPPVSPSLPSLSPYLASWCLQSCADPLSFVACVYMLNAPLWGGFCCSVLFCY